MIELHAVAKRYNGFEALTDIDITVDSGECFGLLGHNGAGKTTLIKLICGLSRPSSGKILLHGKPMWSAENARQKIGYMPEHVVFHGSMSAREVLHFYARLKQVAVRQCDAILDQVGLSRSARQKVGTYSKGMRQRLLLAQALLGNPALLLLDEPTSGLDPELRGGFYSLLEERRRDGTTVLISSHALAELELHADRVAILQHGRVLACAAPNDLGRRTGLPVQLTIHLANTHLARGRDVCERLGIIANADGKGPLRVLCDATQKMILLRQLAAFGDALKDVEIRPPGLDQIYAHFNADQASSPTGERQ